uniref:uncharacterized protein LOC122588007 n=1 Tax=Erigeron canadensis TaxID=72917 RepID=UPI001CB9B29A|nr:uncharacterized protein LOC122588007 [Erigeron canadensis]
MSDHTLIATAKRRFKNIRLQEEYDTHDSEELYKRSKIVEIVAAHGIVFALAESGICAAFSRETNKRICFLNIRHDELIRNLFYNKNDNSVISVSVYDSDKIKTLKFRTTPIEYIRRGMPDAGYALFESEYIDSSGFVEFDDVNAKVLIFSAQDRIYKVFNLKNYMMLYSISDENIEEIKLSTGIMLLVYNKVSVHVTYVPLKILSIEDGTVLRTFDYVLCQSKVDFIELFHENILIKQENENLHIFDARNSELTEVNRTEFATPSAFLYLHDSQLFVTLGQKKVAVWNLYGDLVTSYESHYLFDINNMYITNAQDLIISYCKADSVTGGNGLIKIINVATGDCVAKVKAMNDAEAMEALEDITALFYDEEHNEIYTGNIHGLVHVWSN